MRFGFNLLSSLAAIVLGVFIAVASVSAQSQELHDNFWPTESNWSGNLIGDTVEHDMATIKNRRYATSSRYCKLVPNNRIFINNAVVKTEAGPNFVDKPAPLKNPYARLGLMY